MLIPEPGATRGGRFSEWQSLLPGQFGEPVGQEANGLVEAAGR